MPVRSIVEVQVDDASFKAFNELFQKYNAQLANMPEMWANIGKETEAAGSSFRLMAAALLANNEMMLKLVDAQHKVTLESEKTADAWQHTVGYTHRVLDNIRSATGLLLKWGAIGGALSALGTIGGLFGMDRLAEGVASSRRSALGLGVSYGQQKALDLAFGRFFETGPALGRVARGVYDFGSQEYRGLLGLGISPNFIKNANPADVLVEALRKLPGIVGNARDPGMIGRILESRGIGSLFSAQDVLAYLRVGGQEREAQFRAYGAQRTAQDIDPAIQKGYTDFLQTLNTAEGTIYKVFVEGLAPLNDPLGKLATSFSDVVKAFFKSDLLRGWIDTLGKDLEWFAKKIDTPEFKQAVEGLVGKFGELVGAVSKAVEWFLWAFGEKTKQAQSNRVIDVGAERLSFYESTHGPNKITLADIAALRTSPVAQERGLGSILGHFFGGLANAPTELDRMVGLVRRLEGSGDAAVSPAGAIGRYQIMPGTARQYGYDPSRLTDPAYNERVARAILNDLNYKYHGNLDEILTAYNAGPKRADQLHAAGGNTVGLPLETQKYLERAHNIILENTRKQNEPNQPPTTATPGTQTPGPQSQIYTPTPRIVVTVNEAPGTNTAVTGESIRFG